MPRAIICSRLNDPLPLRYSYQMSQVSRLIWKFALPPALAVALLTLVMLGFERQQLSETLLEHSQVRSRQRAELLGRQVGAELNNAIHTVRMLARSPLIRPTSPAEAVRAELDNVVLHSDKFVWIGLVGLDGQVLAGSRGWLEGRSIAQRPVFQRGREGMVGDMHPAVVLAPLLATLPDGASELIDIGEPIRDAQGQVIGVVAAHLGLHWVRTQVAAAIGLANEASQLGLSAYVLTGNDNRSVVPDQPLPDGLPTGNADMSSRWRATDGQVHTVGRASLASGPMGSGLLPWRVLVLQSEEAVLEPVNQLSRHMAVVGILAALLLAAMSVWLSRRILSPWGSLFDALLSTPAHGDLRMSADVVGRVRSVLAKRGNATPAEQMMGWLAQDVDNLRRAIDHLPLGLVLVDREFRVEYINPAYTRMLGWDTDTCRGHPAGLALVAPREREALAQLYHQLSDPPGEFCMRLEALAASGEQVAVQWHMVPMVKGESQWIGGLVVVHEISAERQAIQHAEGLSRRLRLLSDAAVDTLLATMDADGMVLEWSPGAEKLTGIRSGQALGHHLSASLGDAGFEAHHLHRAAEEGIAPVVMDAGGRSFEGSIYALDGLQGQAARFGLILRDTSEQRALIQQLKLGEQRLRLALQAAQLATWEIDLSSDPPQVIWAEGYARMLGLPDDARTGDLGLKDVIHPDDWERVLAALRQCTDSAELLQIEFRIRHGQDWRDHALHGQTLHDGNGRAQRLLGAGMDVTDQRLARQALSDSQARFGAIITNASDAIISVDLSGRINLFNPAAERVFGYTAPQMLGRPLTQLLPEQARHHHQIMVEGFAHSGVTQRAMGAGRVRGVHASGRLLELEASISQAVANGQIVLTAILRDVTERVAQIRQLESAREELTQLNRRLLEQEKQSSRHLAQALHDELGQTLAQLRQHWNGFAAADASQREKLASHIAELVERAHRQVRGVMAELRPPLLDERGLAAALETEMRQHRPMEGMARIRMDASARARQQRWLADVEYAAFMIAREALINALRHAHATEIVLVLDGDAHSLVLTVRDDGVGIDAATRHGRPGHLGLIGMRERAHGIGAQLQVEGDPGHGTVVTLRWSSPDGLSVAK